MREPSFDQGFVTGLDELFRWRRDVRHFRSDPLPDELLAALIETAGHSPSVGLSQPWRFVTVRDRKRREAIRANFLACNADALAAQAPTRAASYARLKLAALEEAPCHLAVFVDPNPVQGHGLGRHTMPETIAYSAVMAIHTLWLAARAREVGLGWVSILEPEGVRKTLDVPEDWQFISYLCLGYAQRSSDRPELERKSWAKRQPPIILDR